ncbi:hypothetical protein FXO38_13944 [Capsicum annuum]|nr:hypothetical protein FXO38_13944 [Capsicum annuum]
MPKKLEKYLIENGLKGNPYKLLYGDFKELKKSVIEAQSKPINFSDDIAQKLIPFFLNAINKNGDSSPLRHNLHRSSSISRDLSPPGYNGPSMMYNSNNFGLVEESKASP